MPFRPSYSEDEARAAIESARTWRDVLEVLGLSYHGKTINTVRKWASRWQIPTEHLTDERGRKLSTSRYSEEEARAAIAASRSWAETLRRLCLCHSGGNWKILKRRAAEWQISVDHFDSRAASREASSAGRLPLERILVENSTYHRVHLKERLYEAGLKERRCEMCGQDEHWRGHPMSLILDHINGIRDDNRVENLRIICPNCAATLETHCGRKNRLDIAERECERCSKTYRPKRPEQRYCSLHCGSRARQPWAPRPLARRVERPPLDQLLAEIDELGYLAVGRKYGVSDNAIRKWVRDIQREIALETGAEVDVVPAPTRTWPNRRR